MFLLCTVDLCQHAFDMEQMKCKTCADQAGACDSLTQVLGWLGEGGNGREEGGAGTWLSPFYLYFDM